MKEILELKGWVMYHECITPCEKQYYIHSKLDRYEIIVKKSNNTFSVFLNNMLIHGPFWGFEMEDKLNKNGL